MNEQTLIWLLGILGFWCLTLTGWVWNLRGTVKDMALAVDLFINGMGKAAAKVIHRDDDLWEIDGILDRYQQSGNDVSLQDWIRLKEVMDKLHEDKEIPAGTKLAFATVAFAMLSAIASHKIYGKDPRIKKAIEEALRK
jgi:hypothetical protein